MKYLLILLMLTVSFAQEFKVEGDLDVSGNKVLNVADATNETDAVNMRTMNTNSSLKPGRIYRLQVTDETVYTTPTDKYWRLLINYNGNAYTDTYWPYIVINNITYELFYTRNSGGQGIDTKEYWLLPGDTFYCEKDYDDQEYHIVIFEYSFTNSGTSQGMDYIEP